MKRFAAAITSLALLLAPLVLFAHPVAAFDPFSGTKQTCSDPSGSGSSAPISGSAACDSSVNGSDPLTGPNGLLIKVANLLAVAGGVAAVVMIIINGLRFVLSNGTPDRVEGARNGVIYAVVGLVVIILARSIIVFVLNKL